METKTRDPRGRKAYEEVPNSKMIAFRCSDEMHEKLKKISFEKGIPMLHYVRYLLTECLKNN